MSSNLQRELQALSEQAVRKDQLGELEDVYIDLFSLSQRLNWVQLGELLSRTGDSKTVSEYAHLARVAPEQLAVIYTAALCSNSADRVATYLIKYGKQGTEDLRMALTYGEGAVNQLLLRRVPVNRDRAPALSEFSGLALMHPKLGLLLKYIGFLLGAFLLFRGMDRGVFARNDYDSPVMPRMQSGLLALVSAALLVVAMEPFLLQAAPLSEYRFRIVLTLLAQTGIPPTLTPDTSHAMNTSTLISIGFIALLQVATYLVCLRKLREIH